MFSWFVIYSSFFFFQAEDGIRDPLVTGVQTCALPISLGRSSAQTLSSLSTARPVMPPIFHLFGNGLGQSGSNLNFGAVSVGAPRSARKRSEERRVGKSVDLGGRGVIRKNRVK